MVSLGDTVISLHIIQLPLAWGRGVFWERSGLDSGGKIGFLEILGWRLGGGCSGPNFSTKSALPLSGNLCITDGLSHTTYVETNDTCL